MVFSNDLQFGKKYEQLALQYLVYDTVEFAPDKKFSDYDFVTMNNDNIIKYEVKSDRLTHKTGNLAIEYECNKKPSGVSTTKADYYMYFVVKPDSHDCYKIPVDVLKSCTGKGKKMYGGDGRKSLMALVPISDFEKYKFFVSDDIKSKF